MARENGAAGAGNHTGTIVLVGGGALLLWLLLRGKGFGFGSGPGVGLGAGGDGPGTGTAPAAPGPPCQVFIRANRIDLDGAAADLPTVVARCRAAGSADVRATGDAIEGVVSSVLLALKGAGVSIHATPDVWAGAHVIAGTP